MSMISSHQSYNFRNSCFLRPPYNIWNPVLQMFTPALFLGIITLVWHWPKIVKDLRSRPRALNDLTYLTSYNVIMKNINEFYFQPDCLKEFETLKKAVFEGLKKVKVELNVPPSRPVKTSGYTHTPRQQKKTPRHRHRDDK